MKKLAFVIAVLVLCAAIIVIPCVVNRSKTQRDIAGTTKYCVSSGETLWSIAEEINPGIDVRSVVHDIKTVNGWDTTPTIYNGEIINIPLY